MLLGQIQKAWIASLREHPERQGKNTLGKGTPENYTACCLGELHIIGCKMRGLPSPFADGIIVDNTESKSSSNHYYLYHNFDSYGLRENMGRLEVPYTYKGWRVFNSLADMNDNGMTWPEIADYIEANPDNVFTKSV